MYPKTVRDAIVEQLLNSDEVKIHGYKVVKCQACRNPTLDNYYVCPTCGWEYDPFCTSDIFPSGVNFGMSPLDYAMKNIPVM